MIRIIRRAESWEFAVLGKELCGTIDAYGLGFRTIKFIEAVVVLGWAKVPCVNASWCPGLSSGGVFPDDGFSSWWRHQPFIEIVLAVKLFVC